MFKPTDEKEKVRRRIISVAKVHATFIPYLITLMQHQTETCTTTDVHRHAHTWKSVREKHIVSLYGALPVPQLPPIPTWWISTHDSQIASLWMPSLCNRRIICSSTSLFTSIRRRISTSVSGANWRISLVYGAHFFNKKGKRHKGKMLDNT